MEKKIFSYFCCVFFYSIIQSVYSFSIFVEPLESTGDNGIFESIFQNLRQIMATDEELPLKTLLKNNTTTMLNEDEPQNVFESNRIVELPHGGEKIEKLIEKEYFDKNFLKKDVKRELTVLYKFPNHTFKMIKEHGVNMTEKEESDIDCIENDDCNTTSYCLKDSYTCQGCHEESQFCTQSFQCCLGNICDPVENICRSDEDRTYRTCAEASDCPFDHCCAINDDGKAVCQPYLKEGEDCSNDPFEFFTTVNQRDRFTDLPNKCPCYFPLICRRETSFPFFVPKTCQQKSTKKRTNNKNNIEKMFRKLHYYHKNRRTDPEEWQFHSDDDLAALPVPAFSNFQSSHKSIINNLDHANKQKESTTTESPISKLRNNKNKKDQKTKSIFDEKIRFNPSSEFSVKFHSPSDNNDMKSLVSADFDRNDDSDDEDLFDIADKNDMLDSVNNDDDNSDDDFYTDAVENKGHKRPSNSHTDTKEKFHYDNEKENKLSAEVTEKARHVTHKVVDSIFDNLMKGVIQSTKYQA